MPTAPKNTPAAPPAPTHFKEGDFVQIIVREQTPSDIKSGLYFPHFGNMRGKILKPYGEEASVLIDRASLPDNIRTRHEQSEKAERQKYLDRLSEEAKGRLGQKEKEFSLNYAVLVSMADLRAATLEETEEEAAKRISASELDAAEEAFLAEKRKGARGA